MCWGLFLATDSTFVCALLPVNILNTPTTATASIIVYQPAILFENQGIAEVGFFTGQNHFQTVTV